MFGVVVSMSYAQYVPAGVNVQTVPAVLPAGNITFTLNNKLCQRL